MNNGNYALEIPLIRVTAADLVFSVTTGRGNPCARALKMDTWICGYALKKCKNSEILVQYLGSNP